MPSSKNILLTLICLIAFSGIHSQELQTKTVLSDKTNTSKDSLNKVKFDKLISTKNLFSLNALGFLNSCLSLSYIREFPKNHVHLYIPFSVGYANPSFSMPNSKNTSVLGLLNWFPNSNRELISSEHFYANDFNITRKSYEIGIGLHLQKDGPSGISYFIGPYIGTEQLLGTYSEVTAYANRYGGFGGFNSVQKKFILTKISMRLDNGILYRVNKNFNVLFLTTFGNSYYKFEGKDLTQAENFSGPTNPIGSYTLKFNVSFGYRFY